MRATKRTRTWTQRGTRTRTGGVGRQSANSCVCVGGQVRPQVRRLASLPNPTQDFMDYAIGVGIAGGRGRE